MKHLWSLWIALSAAILGLFQWRKGKPMSENETPEPKAPEKKTIPNLPWKDERVFFVNKFIVPPDWKPGTQSTAS